MYLFIFQTLKQNFKELFEGLKKLTENLFEGVKLWQHELALKYSELAADVNLETLAGW